VSRLILHGLALLVLLAAAAVAHADEVPIPEQTILAATEADLDPVDVQGAANSTGVDARTYLIGTGELQPPPPPATVFTVWDRVAQCESNGRWNIDAYHDGGLQFHPGTWSRYKPAGYPAFAYQASREQQINVAERVLRVEGWDAWPTCSRILRLR
jgi:hypothetical protein